MYLNLFDRGDQLGSNIINYIAQILIAFKLNLYIRYTHRTDYSYHSSIFVICLFQIIDFHNQRWMIQNPEEAENEFHYISDFKDLIHSTTVTLYHIEEDLITNFHKHFYPILKPNFEYLTHSLSYSIPFDPQNTILIHLRLGDVAHRPDYDGKECSFFYKERIKNKQYCGVWFYNRINCQAPLSKIKLETMVQKAKKELKEPRIIFLTSPSSDTKPYGNYETLQSDNEDYDLYLLSICENVILSRSNFSFSSLFFSDLKKKRVYIPLWGHFICYGLDTVYDRTNSSPFSISYFYD